MHLQTLRGKLESMKMKESENVSDYITRVQIVANQLNRNGEMLPETRVVEKILRSLIDNFENVVCAIEESKDLAKFKVDELADSLEAHEQRKKKKEESLDQALQTKTTIKDGKILYSQNFRGRDRGSRGNGRGGQDNSYKENYRRRDYRAKQIGVEEDAIKSAVNDTIPTSSALNVRNMAIMQDTVKDTMLTSSALNVRNMATMQIIATSTYVTIVAEWVTMREIVEPKRRWKKPST